MESFIKKYLKGDPVIWWVFFFLCAFSVLEMYSASSTLAFKARSYNDPVLKHIMFLSLGIALAITIQFLKFFQIRFLAYLGTIVSIILLVLVMFKGTSANDASRWIEIGGIQFQPSELAKLSMIVLAADFISRIKNQKTDEPVYFKLTLFFLGVICLLILFENLSTAVLLFTVVFIMMYIGNISWKKLALLIASLVLVGGITFAIFKAIPENTSTPKLFHRVYTWVNRIDEHFGKDETEEAKYEINDDNLQVQHGKMAVARGGIFGVFPGNSVQRDYLPQAYSDFIYAIIVEETGMVGGIFVILLYLILLYRAGRLATKSPTVFPAVLVIGLSLMLVIQAFINMAVATSLIPVTGQPLPLISRGGTSIVVTCIYFGLILAITRQLKEENEKPVIKEKEIAEVDLDELK
jgi:cell division protein FtsW